MVFDPFNRFTPQDFIFKIAQTQEEMEGFWALTARFFQRLHWEPVGELELFGLRHVKMRADLGYYRPAECVF